MPDYGKAQASATRLIKGGGIAITASRLAVVAYDPVEGAEVAPVPPAQAWSLDAVVLPATIARFRGIDNKLAEDENLVLTKARYLLASARNRDGVLIPEPLPEDRVVFHGKTWRVVGASPLRPAEIEILYQIGVLLVD